MKKETIKIGGKDITLETGEIAKQANGSIIIRQEDTIVLVTVVAAEEANEDASFFPLSVEYREKKAAAGKIPSGFIKRESRLQDHEILSSRLIDRSIRPLFPESFLSETQVIATVFSYDKNAEADILSILGTSAALYLSDIPWDGPVGGVHLVVQDEKMVVFPDATERKNPEMDLVISCSKDGLVMLEGEAHEASEEKLLEAITFTQKSLEPFFALLEKWKEEMKVEKREVVEVVIPEEMKEAVAGLPAEDLQNAILGNDKLARKKAVKAFYKKSVEELLEKFPENEKHIITLLDNLKYKLFRGYMAQEDKRVDGRNFDEVRDISGKAGWLPKVHGSSLFTRGETQAIVTCTLGTLEDEQIVETLDGESRDRFLLHYNFPPYCVGEVRPVRGPGRREIGHGTLAKRALSHVLPDYDSFPYTIRIVSDITESNGSSSMATVCGGCLSLMDAGIPIANPVAGVAMGLVKEADKVMVLSDIMGEEDHYGDMDFKVAGTENGITAVQMDNKLGSLPHEVMSKAVEQAKQSRLHILAEMKKILAKSREDLAASAPRVSFLQIRKERIRDVIGSGGKTIQGLQERYKVRIDIDSNSGNLRIYSEDQESAQGVLKEIRYLVGEVEVGKFYKGQVTSIKNFGAFVKIFNNVEGLVHISELANERIKRVQDVVKEGEHIIIKVLGVDRQGKIKLSRKEALEVSENEISN